MDSSVGAIDNGEFFRLAGRFAHWVSGRLGSASIIVTEPPWLASSVASRTAAVDLPTPPLGLRTQWLAYSVPVAYKIWGTLADSYSDTQEKSDGYPISTRLQKANRSLKDFYVVPGATRFPIGFYKTSFCNRSADRSLFDFRLRAPFMQGAGAVYAVGNHQITALRSFTGCEWDDAML